MSAVVAARLVDGTMAFIFARKAGRYAAGVFLRGGAGTRRHERFTTIRRCAVKVCEKCGRSKPLDQYWAKHDEPDKKARICIKCYRYAAKHNGLYPNTIISDFDHILNVCQYHANTPEPQWAKRFLASMVDNGTITAEQANEIRRACGWSELAQQLRLV
jgi:hypothetical protein